MQDYCRGSLAHPSLASFTKSLQITLLDLNRGYMCNLLHAIIACNLLHVIIACNLLHAINCTCNHGFNIFTQKVFLLVHRLSATGLQL